MNIGTILVPIDFSTCSWSLVREVSGLASTLRAKMVLLHVAQLPAGLPADTAVRHDGVVEDAVDYLSADATTRIVAIANAVEYGVPVDTRVSIGPVVPTILEVADQCGADLVVMGTHGRTGLSRLVLGSVAEGVSRASRVPVLLVRREPRPGCGRDTCAWCSERSASAAEAVLQAERDG